MRSKDWFLVAILAAALLLAATPARAADAAAPRGDIPSSAVARLKITSGSAWVRSGDAMDWEEAVTNYPLAEGSRVSVPEGSEAEVQFRGSQSLDLIGSAEVDLIRLAPRAVSYRLRDGRARLSLPDDSFAPVQVDVPGDHEVRLETPGVYSFSTNGQSTRFLVSAGSAAVTGPEGLPVAVYAGEEASIDSDVRISQTEVAPAETPREPALTEPEQAADVPPEVAAELRPYGEWVDTPDYGYAWRPYVSDGWEPYYYGRWVWLSPYGWTWVGYEPWGWWPYHTGWWWPSPVYGWVWCPYRSFVSANLVFGGSVYHGYHARFHRANVRFEGRGGFVRWVPERPGVTGSRLASFGRSDARLALWNRPVARGSVFVRRDSGPPAAWQGRGGRPASADGVRAIEPPPAGRRGAFSPGRRARNESGVRPPVSPGRAIGNMGSRPDDNRGGQTVQHGRGAYNYPGGMGRTYGNAGIRETPRPESRGRAIGRVEAPQSGERERSVGGIERMGSRGREMAGFRSPVRGSGRAAGSSYRRPPVGRGYDNRPSYRGPSIGRVHGAGPSYPGRSIGRIGSRFEGSRGAFGGGSRGFGRHVR